MRSVLVLTDSFDAHADTVITIMEKNAVCVFRLNLDVQSLRSTSVVFNNRNWRLTQDQKEFHFSDISVVWCRRSTVSLTSEQEGDLSNGFRLWRSEWNRTLFGLYNSLSSCFWLNPIQKSALADNKFHQLNIASSIGFNIPAYITSNDKHELQGFASENDKCALKFMSQDIYKSESGDVLGLYVNVIDKNNLVEFGALDENPITLQKYIDKSFEVRYTFIGGEHLVCRIESQQSEKSKVDWRRYDLPNTPHFVLEPPRSIREAVCNLMRRLDLSFGALDFIVDKDGDWWFLEVNSNGQWLWIEDLTGLQIARSIAGFIGRQVAAFDCQE